MLHVNVIDFIPTEFFNIILGLYYFFLYRMINTLTYFDIWERQYSIKLTLPEDVCAFWISRMDFAVIMCLLVLFTGKKWYTWNSGVKFDLRKFHFFSTHRSLQQLCWNFNTHRLALKEIFMNIFPRILKTFYGPCSKGNALFLRRIMSYRRQNIRFSINLDVSFQNSIEFKNK